MADRKAASDILGGALSGCFELTGQCGQILSHRITLWIKSATDGTHDLLLRAKPCGQARRSPAIGRNFKVCRRTPMGPVDSIWEEVAMVELPFLLRIMMGTAPDGKSGATGTAIAPHQDGYLVDEEEEFVIMHAWRRRDGGSDGTGAPPVALDSLEQLLWYDGLASLAEMKPCLEAPVPASRLTLSDEGLGNKEELLGIGLEERRTAWPEEDRPRIASLAFFRQYVTKQALEHDAAPRLFPDGGSGSSSSSTSRMLRVYSGTLSSASSKDSAAGVATPRPRPKTLDDLFSADVDFRTVAPWDATRPDEEDPLRDYELTSVFLVCEQTGFVLTFHCLQGVDPCAALGDMD